MAVIIENSTKRRMIRLSIDDVLSIVQQYQIITRGHKEAPIVRDLIKNAGFYIPEDLN